jgi:hypothetical protein
MSEVEQANPERVIKTALAEASRLTGFEGAQPERITLLRVSDTQWVCRVVDVADQVQGFPFEIQLSDEGSKGTSQA